jgi:hypothetical protein
MSVPNEIRIQLLDKLWNLADELGWLALSGAEKSRLYDMWAQDDSIGGVLGHYTDQQGVRVYIKDTLMKAYSQQRHSDDGQARRILGIGHEVAVLKTEVKPHGRWYADGTVVCWGNAGSWKRIVLALYERTYGTSSRNNSAIILTNALGRYAELGVRTMVEDAATRLEIGRVVWVATGITTASTSTPMQSLTLFEAS